MTEIARHRATYADIERAPPHVVAEIVDGVLAQSPRPRPRHSAAASAMGGELIGPFQHGRGGPGGWIIMTEPELHFGEHVVVPDLAAWRRERLPREPETAFISVAPDWVCEVLSPATERFDRGKKRQVYAQAGVAHLWMLDPVSQVLEAFSLAGGRWLLIDTLNGTDAVSVAPFEAISFAMGDLFPFDAPRGADPGEA